MCVARGRSTANRAASPVGFGRGDPKASAFGNEPSGWPGDGSTDRTTGLPQHQKPWQTSRPEPVLNPTAAWPAVAYTFLPLPVAPVDGVPPLPMT
jgi:hypothetical protein